SKDELVQMTPLDIKPDYGPETFKNLLQRLIDGHKGSLTFRTRHRHKDGHDIPVEIFLQYINNDSNPHFVAIVRDISEQTRIERKLRRSEELLLEAQAIAHIGNWNLDIVTGQATWSRELFHLFGYDPKTVQPSVERFMAAIHPDDFDAVKLAMERAMDPHIRQAYEVRFRVNLEDELRIVEENGRVVFDDNDKPLRMYGTTMDVTSRVQAEQRYQRLVSILEATTDLVGIADPEGRVLYLNQSGRAMCGLWDHEIDELSIFEFHPDTTVQMLMDEAFPRVREQGVWSGESEIKDLEGHVIPVSQVIISHRDEQGNLLYYSTIIRDISERQEQENRLKQLNEKLEVMVQERTATIQEQSAILDQIHDSVITTDMQGVITGWNKGAERLFGYTAVESLGQPVNMIYPEDQHEYLARHIIEPLQQNGELEVEAVMQRKSGEHFDVHISLTLLRDKAGKPIGMAGYTLDISDRKQAERNLIVAMQQAEEASRSKSEFLSRMSHELRTPMNAILGFSQLLEQNISGNLNAEEMDYVNEVMQAGRHLLELINEVLDLSRIESGRMQLSLETIELNELIKECVSLIRPLADEKSIRIELKQPDRLSYAKADRVRLKQIILNLLSNAVKYNHNDGHIEFTCEEKEKHYRIRICDNGQGIPETMQHRVFDPFDRLGADKTSIEGTGIGLSLSKRLIEYMGGTLGFTSTEGKGSCFWFDIGRARGREGDSNEPGRMSAAGLGEATHKMLYIEHNPSNLRLVRRLLATRPDISLVEAKDLEQASEQIRAHHVKLILVNLHMPGEDDSYQLIQRLRVDDATRNIPVVALSADASEHDIQQGLAAGFQDYLHKPIDLTHFYRILDQYIGATQAQ
ncbi:MAG: PAS domain S-box protein, partial [Gammaproteobacteria bacterium]|nr:PAS domain S-box protein [Gammaproteobacteria bacterium]